MAARKKLEEGAPKQKKSARSAVRVVANAIRRDALELQEGDLLGSEQELLERYGVSRPTLRQAAALVAQENLLRIRRGVKGGYFVTRPDSRAVAHVAAIYLRSRGTMFSEILNTFAPIRIHIAQLAASCKDETLRARLAAFLEEEASIDPEELRYKDFLRREREFGEIVEAMSGNQVISLFQEILYDFAAMAGRDEDLYINRRDRVEDFRVRRNKLGAAILEGDEEMAVLAARRSRMFGGDEQSAGDGKQNSQAVELMDFGQSSGPNPKKDKSAAV